MNLDDIPPALNAGLFGATPSPEESHFWVLPIPYEATVSYGAGTAKAPENIRLASHQIDLFDIDVGRVFDHGFYLASAPNTCAQNDNARAKAEGVIDALQSGRAPIAADITELNALGERLRKDAYDFCANAYRANKTPVVLGGDHSVALGAILAASKAHPDLGVLQIDAHADLRDAYEGFQHSHASVLHNALEHDSNFRLISVGLRDVAESEWQRCQNEPRIRAFFDDEHRRARLSGKSADFLLSVVETLPQDVYITLDVDGLQPSYCPSTGTPVPGGLTFDECVFLFGAVTQSGRRIVGFDLVETGAGEWDANVSARLLYKLAGYSHRSKSA